MKRTSLYEEHKKLNAKLVDFAGWEMPIQYKSVKDEILAVRQSVGVFDVSHMGEFWVEGKEAMQFLNYLLPNQINVPVGKAVYSPLLNNDAKILDDLIVYRIKENKFLICVNASNIDKDWDWIEKHSRKFDCHLANESKNTSLLAIQGPQSEKILSEYLAIDLSNLEYYSITAAKNCTIARTGYTGEDGFEVFCRHETAQELWSFLISHNVTPCGLAARDTLRLEVGYPLYGQELTEELMPTECGLNWTIKMNKENFIGRDALEINATSWKPVKLSMDKGIPRQGYKICSEDGKTIGAVTSGTMSPHLNKGIAMGRVNKNRFPEDKKFTINIRDKLVEATLHTGPFLKGGHK